MTALFWIASSVVHHVLEYKFSDVSRELCLKYVKLQVVVSID